MRILVTADLHYNHGKSKTLAEEVIEEMNSVSADVLLVVGSHGWGAMKRTLFGSVSAGVLHRAACPVLVVPWDVAAENGAAVPKAERARA